MSLRTKVMLGSLYLALREGLGMMISLASVFIITHLIRKEPYGIFAAATSICLFLQTVAPLGMGIFLIRQEGEQTYKDYDQVFTLMLLSGTASVTLALLCTAPLQNYTKISGFAPIFELMVTFSFVKVLSQLPLAKLERNLDFKSIAQIELLEQILMFSISLPMALKGYGPWAPTIGWCVSQVQTLILLFYASRLRPKLCWDSSKVRQILSYGFGLSVAGWVWDLQHLIPSLVVAPLMGTPEAAKSAVATISLAIRMLDVLSFTRKATFRISISALAKIQDDTDRLRNAISEGMELQILALGPVLAVSCWVGPILLPILFGQEWISVMTVFPFISVAYMSNAAFNLHCSGLSVLRRNFEMGAFHAAYVLMLAAFSHVLVPYLGVTGYGLAATLSILAYFIVHWYITQYIGSPAYQLSGLWLVAFCLAFFSYQIGWWVVPVLGVVLLLPISRYRFLNLFRMFQTMRAS